MAGKCDFIFSISSSITTTFSSSDLLLGFFFRIIVFFVFTAAVSSFLLPRLNLVLYSSLISISESFDGWCVVSCFVMCCVIVMSCCCADAAVVSEMYTEVWHD